MRKTIKTKVVLPAEDSILKHQTTKKVIPSNKSVPKQYIFQKSPRHKGMWEVKIKGSSHIIKLFVTEPEAKEYSDVMAKNQKASVVKRASKGKKKGKFISH